MTSDEKNIFVPDYHGFLAIDISNLPNISTYNLN